MHVVDETFYSILIDGVNCCYLDRMTFRASMTLCEPAKQKRGFDHDVSVTSSMIKSAKRVEKRRKKVSTIGVVYS